MAEQPVATAKTGVVVVDLQADFTELNSGSLAVPNTGAQYLDAVEKATRRYQDQGMPVYYTQDWHPADHVSFYTNNPDTEPLQVIEIDGRPQVMWPPHCVRGTSGAEIIVTVGAGAKKVRKGTDPRFDSYSGFADDGRHKTELDDLLRGDGIQKLIIYGLATDYCVKATVLDALEAGYQVELVLNLCRGVSPDTTATAIQEMKEKGATIIGSFMHI
jgi:nicotinamidase/pyrazinamidase